MYSLKFQPSMVMVNSTCSFKIWLWVIWTTIWPVLDQLNLAKSEERLLSQLWMKNGIAIDWMINQDVIPTLNVSVILPIVTDSTSSQLLSDQTEWRTWTKTSSPTSFVVIPVDTWRFTPINLVLKWNLPWTTSSAKLEKWNKWKWRFNALSQIKMLSLYSKSKSWQHYAILTQNFLRLIKFLKTNKRKIYTDIFIRKISNFSLEKWWKFSRLTSDS